MGDWDTKNDVFTPGQWFHGRVYEDACDLSADGSLLLYFANKHNERSIAEGKHKWTAVSKPPYFTALEIWFYGDVRACGGAFEDKFYVWLQPDRGDAVPKALRPVAMPNATPLKFVDSRIYFTRLERDGWQVIQSEYIETASGTQHPTKKTWAKSVGKSSLMLTFPSYEYCLTNHESGQEMSLAHIEWMDFDQQNRIVLAKDGKIFSAIVSDAGELLLTELADFNANKPYQLEAPEWARKW